MKKELFADLVASAEAMVAIEKGETKPDEAFLHRFDTVNVKKIREEAGKNQAEFAKIIGASFDTVKSWESNRRHPSGTAKKLLTLIGENPAEMIKVLEMSS